MKILTYIGIRSAFLFTFVISYIEYKKGVDYMCNNENNTCENCSYPYTSAKCMSK